MFPNLEEVRMSDQSPVSGVDMVDGNLDIIGRLLKGVQHEIYEKLKTEQPEGDLRKLWGQSIRQSYDSIATIIIPKATGDELKSWYLGRMRALHPNKKKKSVARYIESPIIEMTVIQPTEEDRVNIEENQTMDFHLRLRLMDLRIGCIAELRFAKPEIAEQAQKKLNFVAERLNWGKIDKTNFGYFTKKVGNKLWVARIA